MTDRASITHTLKTWPPYFQEVYVGRKNFEVRQNDRDFRPMDILELKEFDPKIYEAKRLEYLGDGWRAADCAEQAMKDAYTGRSCERMVGYILYGGDPAIVGVEAAQSGVSPGYVVMSLVSTPRDAAAKRAAYEAGRPAPVPLKSSRAPGYVEPDPPKA